MLHNAIADHDSFVSGIDADVVDRLVAGDAEAERVLLLVDQFEETFTQASRDDANAFIGALHGLRTRGNLALVLTLRADFYPDLMIRKTINRDICRPGDAREQGFVVGSVRRNAE